MSAARGRVLGAARGRVLDDAVFPTLVVGLSAVTLLLVCGFGGLAVASATDDPRLVLTWLAFGIPLTVFLVARIERIARAPQHERLAVEVTRAALLTPTSAVLPCMLCGTLGLLLPSPAWLLVPVPAAAAGCGLFGTFLALLVYRLASTRSRRASTLLVGAGLQFAVSTGLWFCALTFLWITPHVWHPATLSLCAFAIAGWALGSYGLANVRDAVALLGVAWQGPAEPTKTPATVVGAGASWSSGNGT